MPGLEDDEGLPRLCREVRRVLHELGPMVSRSTRRVRLAGRAASSAST